MARVKREALLVDYERLKIEDVKENKQFSSLSKEKTQVSNI